MTQHDDMEELSRLEKRAFRYLLWATLLAFFTFVVYVTQCSPEGPGLVPPPQDPPPPPPGEETPPPPPPEPSLPTPGRHYGLDYIESEIASDLNRFDPASREELRYLVTVDQLNLGHSDGDHLRGGDKALNLVSVDAPSIQPLTKVADGIYRLNLEELNLNAADWQVIEQADELQLESFTGTGLLLKFQTQTRLPWMPVVTFNNTALSARVYHQIANVPATLGQLFQQQGVNFNADLADFKATFSGFAGSPLNLTSHRLAVRLKAAEGFCRITFDPGAQDVAQKNLFAFPGLAALGTRSNFQFLASEVFCQMRNGLHLSALFNAAGQRQDFAPENVVSDYRLAKSGNRNPLAPTIRNPLSCPACHAQGLLPLTDQVRGAINGAGSQLANVADIQRLNAVYRPQAEASAELEKDNERFLRALDQLGISREGGDPIAIVSDEWLRDQTLEEVAAVLLLTPDEFRACLNISQDGRNQIGALLSGIRVTHAQVVAVIDDLKDDCRLFQDPL